MRPGRRFAIRIGAGNENERLHLLPLVDELLGRQLRPVELWADRGYDGEELRAQLRARGVEPVISRRRRRGEPEPVDAATRVYRGSRRRPKTSDPYGRNRWPIERTNSWLRNWRRVSTRWERRADHWLAVLQIAAALTLWDIIQRSLR